MKKSRKALGVKRGSNYHEERAARTTFRGSSIVICCYIRNWAALHCTCLHRKKWWPGSCSRLHMFHERIFENLIANNTRIVQLRIKCNTIIPHVILQMAGGYKFWSGRFLKFASKPTRAESLLIVRLYIHGISVRFGVAVLAFCKKGFWILPNFEIRFQTHTERAASYCTRIYG